ncbi:MAG TPA: cytochrome b/b6 domain-containing protein [Jiangellaceae bacterium]|nr:cytochrome b/b6 domain-containing protein [Jiangellaceae bacterium]
MTASVRQTTGPPETLERNNRRTRWLHAGVYLTVLVPLFTGWWLTLGNEGQPSPLAVLMGTPDAELHTVIGWVFAGLAALGLVLGRRAAWTLASDSLRLRRSELRWFARWPAAVFTGRFGRHEGHFDPGQRIANVVMVVLLVALTVSGIGLFMVSGGPAFVWFNRIHRWSTYLFTPVIVGHVVIAAGVLPGYRGVWRAMHLGGRLRTRDAGRVWPAWAERIRGGHGNGEK